ncbi:MAG: hypothetical protein AMXMBFR56_59990 [Polyangiaceae bacterium]
MAKWRKLANLRQIRRAGFRLQRQELRGSGCEDSGGQDSGFRDWSSGAQAVRIQAGRFQASGDFAKRGLRSGRTGDMRHEQTIVYQKSVQLMETAQALIGELPAGFGFLADQLRRNTVSVIQNFAEGYYQSSVREQRRYFRYAIQSAREASVSFDAAGAFRAGKSEHTERGKGLALELVRMLSKFRTRT